MHIHAIAFGFLQPFCEEYATFVDDPGDADFILTMNSGGHEGMDAIMSARSIADKYEKPLCWWTIEDPNAYFGFVQQARLADYVFTSDKACIPQYRKDCGHDRVFWLPLACSESYHRPLPLREGATDFVFSGNWYDAQWEARRWGVSVVILPLAEAGYSITTFSLDEPPYPILTQAPNHWIKGDGPESPGYFSAVALQYKYGKVVLGVNNQRSYMDGRGESCMTSMRTPEAIACGKPFLASQSDAYEAMGLVNDYGDGHMLWSSNEVATLQMGEYLLKYGRQIAEQGRAFVLEHHTYGRRMERIMACVQGAPGPETWE